MLLTGCSGPNRLDATNTETLGASFDAIAGAYLLERDRTRFALARARYEATYFGAAPAIDANPYLPEWDAVHGMRTTDFLAFAERLPPTSQAELADPRESLGSGFPDPAKTARLLEQYELERTLLEEARERILSSGKNTIDQYPIVNLAYLPPRDDVPLELDRARFLVTVRNDSGFDAYRPEFQVVVRDPTDELPALDRHFSFDKDRTPIGPGEARVFELSCCGAASDRFHNTRLKKLSPDASIEINLLAMHNHGSTAILKTKGYRLVDHLRLAHLNRCIDEMNEDLASWAPLYDDRGEMVCGPEAKAKADLQLSQRP